LTGSRLLRLRVVLLAVESSDLPLEEALRSLRAALREPPPPLEWPGTWVPVAGTAAAAMGS